MDFKDRADSLANKMNKITESLDLSEEMLVEGEELLDYVEAKTQTIKLEKDNNPAEVMNLQVMTEDFAFVRTTLREVTENARRVQNAITLKLLEEDDDKQASLIMSFSELSKAITDAQKLYVTSYKDMSTTLLNIDKINPGKGHIDGESTEHKPSTSTSTADLIKQLQSQGK